MALSPPLFYLLLYKAEEKAADSLPLPRRQDPELVDVVFFLLIQGFLKPRPKATGFQFSF